MGKANLPTSMSTATGADSNLNIGHVFPVMQTKHNRQTKKKIQKKVLWDANLKGQITAYLHNVHQI